jgi:hypothetical protein
VKLTDYIGQSECYGKRYNSPDNCINQNVCDVFAKVLLLQVVASSEDHRRQQAIEEYLLAKLKFFHIRHKVEEQSEDNSDYDSGSCFVYEVKLSERGIHFCVRDNCQ